MIHPGLVHDHRAKDRIEFHCRDAESAFDSAKMVGRQKNDTLVVIRRRRPERAGHQVWRDEVVRDHDARDAGGRRGCGAFRLNRGLIAIGVAGRGQQGAF